DTSGLRMRLAHTEAESRAATPPPPPPPEPPLAAVPAALPDPATIPPREWLYGTRLIRRFVSVLAAPGGVGKSALALAQAVAVASGRPILNERVHHSVPVWVMNLEDPQEEQDRRVAALMQLHAVPRDALAGRLFLHSGRSRRLTMAALDETQAIVHPDAAAVAAACRARGIGLVVVDPFVKSHRLDENSNAQMDAAATAWAEIAEATGAAILLVHHVRKGASADVDAARGAKSLTDAARSAALLAPMTAEEAEHLSVPAAERWRYVRLDDAKANLAPRADNARWFRLETVSLGNATEAYPSGDAVAAIAAWKPPSPLRGMTAADCNRALDLIAAGPGEGVAYSAHRTGRASQDGKGERWAGRVLVRQFGLDDNEAARVIAAWLKSGLLAEAPYHDGKQRKTRLGVRVIDARRPTGSNHDRSNA
ncbi:helicase RepA family protein, partial [Limobrevibacterium gyesilva]